MKQYKLVSVVLAKQLCTRVYRKIQDHDTVIWVADKEHPELAIVSFGDTIEETIFIGESGDLLLISNHDCIGLINITQLRTLFEKI